MFVDRKSLRQNNKPPAGVEIFNRSHVHRNDFGTKGLQRVGRILKHFSTLALAWPAYQFVHQPTFIPLIERLRPLK